MALSIVEHPGKGRSFAGGIFFKDSLKKDTAFDNHNKELLIKQDLPVLICAIPFFFFITPYRLRATPISCGKEFNQGLSSSFYPS